VDEVLKEINHPGSGPAIQAGCYRRGEVTEANAVEWVTKAILVRRGMDTDDWERHTPAVEAALTHALDCDCEECA
jgi:hypothetical protein